MAFPWREKTEENCLERYGCLSCPRLVTSCPSPNTDTGTRPCWPATTECAESVWDVWEVAPNVVTFGGSGVGDEESPRMGAEQLYWAHAKWASMGTLLERGGGLETVNMWRNESQTWQAIQPLQNATWVFLFPSPTLPKRLPSNLSTPPPIYSPEPTMWGNSSCHNKKSVELHLWSPHSATGCCVQCSSLSPFPFPHTELQGASGYFPSTDEETEASMV